MVLFILLIQGIAVGWFCSYVARQKGLGSQKWFWLGFLFSFLALIALVAIPNNAPQQTYVPTSDPMRKCPFCAEMVKAEAAICRYCQHELPPQHLATTLGTPSSSPQSHIGMTEAELMRKYGITREGDKYISISYEGGSGKGKKSRFSSLKEALKSVYGIDV